MKPNNSEDHVFDRAVIIITCCTLSIPILFSNFLLLNLFHNFLFAERSKRVYEWKKKPRNFPLRPFSLLSLLLFIYPDPGLRFSSVSVIFPNPFWPYLNTFFSLDISSSFVTDSSVWSQCYRRFCAPHTGVLAYPLRSFIKSTTYVIFVLCPVFPYWHSYYAFWRIRYQSSIYTSSVSNSIFTSSKSTFRRVPIIVPGADT